MSVKAMAWAWAQSCSPASKIVLLALADHADDEGICWPGRKGVAKKVGVDERNITRHISKLEQVGLIEALPRYRPDGSRTTNLYRLVGVIILSPPLDNIIHTPLIKSSPPLDASVHTPWIKSSIPLDTGAPPRTIIEPSLEPSPVLVYHEALKLLESIEHFVLNEAEAQKTTAYFLKKGISIEQVETTAIAMQGKIWYERGLWRYKTLNGNQATKNLLGVLKTWATRKPLEAQNAKSNSSRTDGSYRGSPQAQWPSAAHIPLSEHARDAAGLTGAPLPPELRVPPLS